jgi:hypothetical protein
MTERPPLHLRQLLAHARCLIAAARDGAAPLPPFDDLIDRAAAALLVAMAFREVARDLPLRGTAAAAAAAIAGLARAAREGADPADIEAALEALESLLARAAAPAGAAA